MNSLRQLIRIILEDYTPDHSDRVRPVVRPHNKKTERDEVPTMYKKDRDQDDDLADHLQNFDDVDPHGETFGPVSDNGECDVYISMDPYVRDAMPGTSIR
jgi:hypothetical protein